MWLASTDDLPALKSFYERALHLKQRAKETGNQFVIEQQERIIATLAVRINMESRWLSPINKQQLAISLRTTVNTKTSRGNPKAAWLWELVGEEPFSCYQQTGGLPQCWVDLVIRHPEPTYRNGRPAWLRTPDCCVVQGDRPTRVHSRPASPHPGRLRWDAHRSIPDRGGWRFRVARPERYVSPALVVT